MYYLYLKTSPLGLKYLGKFTKRVNRSNFTVYDYLGSGKIWKQHIQKYRLTSKDIQTQVLLETDDYEELKKVALEYSMELHIALSPQFANLVPEDGACPVKYCDFSKRATPEYRSKISQALTGKPKSKEHVSRVVETRKTKGYTPWNKGLVQPYTRTDETKQKMQKSHRERSLKIFKEKLDPIIENLILDSTQHKGRDLQRKYKLTYAQFRRAKKVYGF